MNSKHSRLGSTYSRTSNRRPVTIASTLVPQLPELDPAVEEDSHEEERETGAISRKVYTEYIRATGSWLWIIIPLLLLCLTQLTNIANSLFLGFWSSDQFNMAQREYMAVYAGLGFGIALFTVSRPSLMHLEKDVR